MVFVASLLTERLQPRKLVILKYRQVYDVKEYTDKAAYARPSVCMVCSYIAKHKLFFRVSAYRLRVEKHPELADQKLPVSFDLVTPQYS